MKTNQRIITDVQLSVLRSELQHMKQNCTITPDTDASYRKIVEILNKVEGV